MVSRHSRDFPIERTPAFATGNGATLAFELIADDQTRRVFGYLVVQGTSGDGLPAGIHSGTGARTDRQAFDAACREHALRMAAMLRLPGRICLSFALETIANYRYGAHAVLRSAQRWGISADRLVFVLPVDRPPLEPCRARRWASAIHNRGATFALSVGRATSRPVDTVIGYRPDVVILGEQLIRSIDHHDIRRFELSGIVGSCISTGASVVAKGVSTEGERNALFGLGIRLLHGSFTVQSGTTAPATPAARIAPAGLLRDLECTPRLLGPAKGSD